MSREEETFRDGVVRLVTRRAAVDLNVKRQTTIQRKEQEKLLSQIQRDRIRWVE